MEKTGRHIDDFLVTRPEPNVERFLAQASDKLNIEYAARLDKTGDNFLNLHGEPLLVHGIVTALGKENAKARLIPETTNDTAQMKHESSRRVLANQCTSVIIVQTLNTA